MQRDVQGWTALAAALVGVVLVCFPSWQMQFAGPPEQAAVFVEEVAWWSMLTLGNADFGPLPAFAAAVAGTIWLGVLVLGQRRNVGAPILLAVAALLPALSALVLGVSGPVGVGVLAVVLFAVAATLAWMRHLQWRPASGDARSGARVP